MFFSRIDPDPQLSRIIECFWIAEDESTVVQNQKIIPDGFTEIIFHFGALYRICLDKKWEVQSKGLIAGQISKHFFLENTGVSSFIGIKLKPTALTHLYSLNMFTLTDRVVDVHHLLGDKLLLLEQSLYSTMEHADRVNILNDYFKKTATAVVVDSPVDRVINHISRKQGIVTVAELCVVAGVGERQLENLFKKWIGLSPKLYSRIIRFNYIFDLVQNNKGNWSDLAYEASYYDQSHFIRNFKNFTGENPSSYSFNEQNMANFFLKKKE
jgi:AraC-like DNA-binding protein